MKPYNDSAMTDEQAILDYRMGNRNRLGLLYRRYYKKVLQHCMEYTKSQQEAHDLTQDILMKAFDHLAIFRGESRFSTWLYAITKNTCIEYIRKNDPSRFIKIEQVMNLPAEENHEDACTIPCIERLLHTMEHLSPSEREILEMKYTQNKSIKDLQQKYNLSASAVKMRLKRARSKILKTYLEEFGEKSAIRWMQPVG
jgi:RNA polymerase sigma-70 factor (ECF subfamily)